MNASIGPQDAELAAYQARLLDILHDGDDGAVMGGEIRAAAGGLPLGELDPTLIEVAADLTRTWGRIAAPPLPPPTPSPSSD